MEVYVMAVLIVAAALFVLCRGKRKTKKDEGAEITVPKENNAETSNEEMVNVPTEFPVYWIDEKGNEVEGVARMARGIQIFDESGNCIIDLTNKLTRILGSGRTNGTSGSLSDSNIQGNNCWAIATNSYTDAIAIPPIFSTSNGVLSWTYPGYSGKFPYTVKNLDCDFIYGTY